jgi:DNA-binding transcriptional regulator LsrR (DeoR family)
MSLFTPTITGLLSENAALREQATILVADLVRVTERLAIAEELIRRAELADAWMRDKSRDAAQEEAASMAEARASYVMPADRPGIELGAYADDDKEAAQSLAEHWANDCP